MLIGIDVGGTFTDAAAIWTDESDGSLRTCSTKVPSTRPEVELGVLNAVDEILRLSGGDAADIERVMHGTTVALNAILERKGAHLSIITTTGFEDLLRIGRSDRRELFDLFLDDLTPEFLCARERIFDSSERMLADGTPLAAPDPAEIDRIIERLREEKVESVALCLLHSYANPEHERVIAARLHSALPDVEVSVSSEVDPRFREYERLTLTAFDAYVKPVMRRYISSLRDSLHAIGVQRDLQVMSCAGGLADAERVSNRPIGTIMSGPAAGVIGVSHTGEHTDFDHFISLDIGGTSSDVALLPGGQPLISPEGRIGRYSLRQATIDVNSIGAGGGSIAWVDDAGSLHVGPQSAGSVPGPACYGRGGDEATVTDASLLLGYLNPDRFAYDSVALRTDLSHAAVSRLGAQVGLDVDDAALGIHRIINSNMADQIRLVSIGRGYDPRRFALVALGGAGPLHGGRLAELLGIPAVVVPPLPGVLCAMGLLVAKVEQESTATFLSAWSEVDPAQLDAVLTRLEAEVAARMAEDGMGGRESTTTRTAEMRYAGQSYEVSVPLPAGRLTEDSLTQIATAFHGVHEQLFSHASPTLPVEVVNLRVVRSVQLSRPEHTARDDSARHPSTATPYTTRRAMFDRERGFVDIPIYRRDVLPPGATFVGPAIVEQSDTTTVVYPGHRLEVDAASNLVLWTPSGLQARADKAEQQEVTA